MIWNHTPVGRAALTVISLAGLTLGFGPSAAGATTLHQRLIATAPLHESGGMTAGFGYVAWTENSAGGQRQRVVLRDGKKLRRSDWFTGRYHAIALGRQVDERSGKVVVRLSVTRLKGSGADLKSSLLSPTTLRPSKTKWTTPPTANGTAIAADGVNSVTVETVPAPGPSSSPSAQSQCRVTGTPTPLPPLEDCSATRAILRGSRLVVRSGTPSATIDAEKGSSTSSAWHSISLEHPELGWSLLGRLTSTYDGTQGLQDVCILDHGYALLSGSDTYPGDIDPLTWNVSVVPTDSAQTAWSASAAGIAPQQGTFVPQLGCSDSTLYARYANGNTENGPTPRTRIVELTPRP